MDSPDEISFDDDSRPVPTDEIDFDAMDVDAPLDNVRPWNKPAVPKATAQVQRTAVKPYGEVEVDELTKQKIILEFIMKISADEATDLEMIRRLKIIKHKALPKGASTQRELAEQLEIDPSQLSKLVHRLNAVLSNGFSAN